jgi:hypothetical protein
MEDIYVDLVPQGLASLNFVMIIYAEDDPNHKKAFYFQEPN